MKQVTTWRPDTCKCEVEYEWDNSVSEKDRVHTHKRVVSKCSEHAGVPDVQLLAELFGENQTKNRTVHRIAEVMGYSHQDILEGKIEYNFDQNRKLSFKVANLDATKEAQINAAIEADPEIDTAKSTTRIKAIAAK